MCENHILFVYDPRTEMIELNRAGGCIIRVKNFSHLRTNNSVTNCDNVMQEPGVQKTCKGEIFIIS